MNDWDRLVEFIFKVKQIEQKEKEITANEELARQATWQAQNQIHHQINIQQLLEAQVANNKQMADAQVIASKQTLEIIKLTRLLMWLTAAMLFLGIVQIVILVLKP